MCEKGESASLSAKVPLWLLGRALPSLRDEAIMLKNLPIMPSHNAPEMSNYALEDPYYAHKNVM